MPIKTANLHRQNIKIGNNCVFLWRKRKNMALREWLLGSLLALSWSAGAQTIDLKTGDFPPGNYSGITCVGNATYLLVSDKHSGWFTATLENGRLLFRAAVESPQSPSDQEAIAYFPPANTVFVAAESTQRIQEYTLDGKLTGRELNIPQKFSCDSIYGNYGFESLSYNARTHRFWTVTEHTLKADGEKSLPSNSVPCKLRLLEFDDELNPVGEYVYETDVPKARKNPAQYAFGVSELLALDDGSVLVLEREFHVARKYLGSWVRCKIYRYRPQEGTKTLVARVTTRLNAVRRNLANYEGMCLGPKNARGRQSLFLIADSQNNYGNSLFHLKDYLKIIRLKGL